MHNITFNFLDQHRHGSAFHEYLRLRKTFFVDELKWDIPHNDEVEMDQYDNPCAYYSLVQRNGRVVAGARVMSTRAVWGPHSYMLRDAYRGQIATIPSDILSSDLASDDVWECTRLVTSSCVAGRTERAQALSMVVGGLIDIATRHGGSQLVTLTRPSLMRALRQLGFDVSQIGEAYVSQADGCRYAMLQMPATVGNDFVHASEQLMAA